MLKNEKGFTLVEIIIAAGLLGFLALIATKLIGNMAQGARHVGTQYDESELRRSVSNILRDERYCRVSLAGDGPVDNPTSPVTFNKIDIDEDDEGLDVSFFISNQVGDARTTKKFNGLNNIGSLDKSKLGKIKIKEIKLIMNNSTGSNYTDALVHYDLGLLRVVITKKVSNTTSRDVTFDFDINLKLSTGQSPESSGETRILSCSSGASGGGISQGNMFDIVGGVGSTSSSSSIGVWKMCSLNQYRTTEDNDNNYDNCNVDGTFNGNWTLSYSKHSQDSLTCRAFCIK
jgi:prepilin-type N-terminal cleavage/methylation domain-containing protein